MKTKLMLVVSIILIAVATVIIWKNETAGFTLLIIANLLNLIRGIIDSLHERK
ncbi:MAG: hypothetical protein PHX70_05415 [Clostridium sp.]|nr:hypothetical protein [Clostridium sp.]